MKPTLAVIALVMACAAPTSWNDLRSLDDLKTAFNRDQGRVRVVLLLSPT